MSFRARILLFLLAPMAAPVALYANAGTPLLWTVGLHLLFGNAIIAWVEGIMLSRRFSLSRGCFADMVAANYFSAWAGMFLLEAARQFLDVTIHNAWFWLAALTAVAFVFTVLLEWPVVQWVLRGRGLSAWNIFGAHLKIQAATYAMMLVIYGLISPMGLLTRTRIVPLAEMKRTPDATLYFIAAHEPDVYRLRLNGEPPEIFLRLENHPESERLQIVRSEENTNEWKLAVEMSWEAVIPLTNLFEIGETRLWQEFNSQPARRSFGPAIQLASTNSWNFSTGFFPGRGLVMSREGSRDFVRLAMESPLLSWNSRNVTQLPNDQVVFQLGKDQICLFDPNTMQLALVARGRGPAVALEE